MENRGEFHTSLNLRLDSVTDVNMGFVRGKANQTAADRERDYTAITFTSEIKALDTFLASETVLKEVRVIQAQIYSLNTLVGTFVLSKVKDSNNNAEYYYHWIGEAGATTPNIRATLRETFTPSDVAAAVDFAGSAQGRLVGRSTTLPTAAVARGTNIGAHPGEGNNYPYNWTNKPTGYGSTLDPAGSNVFLNMSFTPPTKHTLSLIHI